MKSVKKTAICYRGKFVRLLEPDTPEERRHWEGFPHYTTVDVEIREVEKKRKVKR